MSITAPTTFTTNLLIADSLTNPNGTEVVSTTDACGIELQSTSTAITFSRLTTAQRNAIANPTNGMILYNTSTNLFNYYVNGAWTTTAGVGGIVVPGVTTMDAVVRWGDNTGGALLDSVVIISDAGDITGVNSIKNANGLVGAPSYAFTLSPSTGMWSSGLDTIDFSTNGLKALQVLPVNTSVNWLAISPSATGDPVSLSALGTDGNIDIELVPQGTGSVIIPVGTAATPSLSFAGDTTTGFYDVAAGIIGVTIAGAFTQQWSVKGISIGTTPPAAAVTNTIKIANGTAPVTSEANSIQLFSTAAVSNGNPVTTYGFSSDATPIAAVALSAIDLSFPIEVNGTTYYIPCKATQD
jgi:hypothetical protein